DIMLPGTDGLEVCRRLRSTEATHSIPIIMLTARAAEVDPVIGLEMGADDYITKPLSPREMVARGKAVLRRADREDLPQPPAHDSRHLCGLRRQWGCESFAARLRAAEVLRTDATPRIRPLADAGPGVGPGRARRAPDRRRAHPPPAQADRTR